MTAATADQARVDIPHALAEMARPRVVDCVHRDRLGIVIDGDVWAARSTLCTRGAPGLECRGGFGDALTCQVKVGNVHAVMAGLTGEAGLNDMYKYCMVHGSLWFAAACAVYG